MKYYVYHLTSADGVVVYVGKGSGNRLAAQRRHKRLAGHEVARFDDESAAYDFEVEQIREMRPGLNIHPGGNGPRGPQVRPADPAAMRERIYRLAVAALGRNPISDPLRPWASALSRAFHARAAEFVAKFGPIANSN